MTLTGDPPVLLVRLVWTCALAALVGCLGAATAFAHGRDRSSAVTSSTPVTRGSGYLALGDSVSFGYQEPAVVPTPNYHQAAGFRGYPEQLGTELHLRVTNLACPGETSASLIDASAPNAGCTVYRRFFPLHIRYRGSQLAYAVRFLAANRGIRLVSLMIGANDEIVCVAQHGCATRAQQRAELAKVSGNVRRILSAVRERGHYGGQIAIVNYYSLDYASPLTDATTIALNNAMDRAAKPFHAEIANGYGELKTASERFGGSPCLAGLITQLGTPGKCGIHPSYAGQALLAKALATAIRL